MGEVFYVCSPCDLPTMAETDSQLLTDNDSSDASNFVEADPEAARESRRLCAEARKHKRAARALEDQYMGFKTGKQDSKPFGTFETEVGEQDSKRVSAGEQYSKHFGAFKTEVSEQGFKHAGTFETKAEADLEDTAVCAAAAIDHEREGAERLQQPAHVGEQSIEDDQPRVSNLALAAETHDAHPAPLSASCSDAIKTFGCMLLFMLSITLA